MTRPSRQKPLIQEFEQQRDGIWHNRGVGNLKSLGLEYDSHAKEVFFLLGRILNMMQFFKQMEA